jgi:hypothetical protein
MNQSKKFSRALCGVALILSGCASISDRKRHQYVYIDSVPSGAAILDKDQKVGTTPALVRLRRNRTYSLDLQSAGQRETVPLETKYWWTDSFYGNLAFLSLAPIGWVTDLLTGAAWKFQDPEPVRFSKGGGSKKKTLRIALAPPIAESFALSDEAAQYWEKQLQKQHPEAQVIPFKESLATFQDNGYDYDERTSDEQKYRQVLYNLPADLIFFSEVRSGRDMATLQAELKDISGKVVEEKVAEAPFVKTESWKTSAMQALPSWFQFIPNTVGMEFANSSTVLMENLVSYEGVETGRKSTLGTAVAYMQALTLSRLQLPRFDRQARWKFLFTPSARFSYKTIFFPTYAKLAFVEFNTLHAGAGIGPEIGYQSGKHYTYLKVIPMWMYFQIDWRQPEGHDETMALGSLDVQSELGYLYFINERMSLRLFSKSSNSNVNLWNSVAQRVNPTTPYLTSSSEVYGGVALGYTFDLHERMVAK